MKRKQLRVLCCISCVGKKRNRVWITGRVVWLKEEDWGVTGCDRSTRAGCDKTGWGQNDVRHNTFRC